MKKTLIFGSSGFVGKYLSHEFYQNGYDVYGCSSKAGVNTDEDLEATYVCDLLDYDQVKNVISEVVPDMIVNLAGRSSVGISWRIPRNTVEVNVCGAINIMEAVRSCNIDCRILMVGSSEEYGMSDKPLNEGMSLNASNPYGISKQMLESFVTMYRDHYGMKLYYVRAFNHTGVGQTDSFVIPSWCRQAAHISLSGEPGVMKVGNLDISRDFSNVKDVVRAYRMILESDDCHVVYNVGSGKAIPLRDIMNAIVSLSEQQINVQVDEKLIRPTEVMSICCDNSLLKDKLGWNPQYDIFDTVEEIFNYYLTREKTKKEKGVAI